MNVVIKTMIQLNLALNEIIRLRRQRQILARHLHRELRLRRLSHHVRGYVADLQAAVLHVSEERDHLRNELAFEKQASRTSLDAMQADLNAARAGAYDLDAKWRDALEAQCQAIVERDEAIAQLRALETANG